MKRFAFVKNADHESHLNSYISGTDYEIIEKLDDHFIIAGEDVAGWTLDEYVIPRLGSGLIVAEEITEDNEIFERNQAVIWFEDSIVLATVVDYETMTFKTFDGYEPSVNRIGIEFRLHLKLNDLLNKWQMENIYAYRTDRPETSPRLPATDNQKGKLYKFFRDTVLNDGRIPARIFLAGQTNGIELAIVSEEYEVDRLMNHVAEHKAKIHTLQVQLEASLAK